MTHEELLMYLAKDTSISNVRPHCALNIDRTKEQWLRIFLAQEKTEQEYLEGIKRRIS